jgi:plasmid stabilization system protein ParE
MKWPIYLSAQSSADMDRIHSWLLRRSPRGAANWKDAVFAAIDAIAEDPQSCSVAAEQLPRWRRKVQQKLFKTKHGRWYRIIFEIIDDEVYIQRVWGPCRRTLRSSDLPRK